MKKKISKIVIILFVFCLGFSIINTTKVIADYNNNSRNIIYGIDGRDLKTIITYKLNDESTFTEIIVNGTKRKIVNIIHGGEHGYNIVDQPNVYCVQHNRTFGYEAYSVGSEINVTDPMLAYILCKGPQMSDGLQKYDEVPSQLALWKYIAIKTNSTDVKKITDNGAVTPVANSEGLKYETLVSGSEAEKIYKEAEEWKNNQSSLVDPSLTANINSNNLEVEVKGTFKKFKLTVNGNERNYEKGLTETKRISLTISSLGSAEKAIIKLEAYGTKYEAKYRILGEKQYDYNGGYYELTGNSRRQRMIVVTGVNIRNTTKTIEVNLDSDVSMQKYITKINGNPITTNDTNITDRSGLISSSDDTTKGYFNRYNKNVTETIPKRTPYKYANPIKIDYGDKVTYKIEIHNNENRTAAGITVVDKLPCNATNQLYVSLENIKNRNGQIVNWTKEETETRTSSKIRFYIISCKCYHMV